MKTTIYSVLAAAAVVCAASNASAINACSNVDVSVKNHHPSNDPVKVVYMKYQVNGAGSWYKEDLADKVPNSGNTVSWSNQDLQNLPEGSGAKFRVYYKRQLTGGVIPTYGDTYYVEFDRTGSSCTDGRSYTFDITTTGTQGD